MGLFLPATLALQFADCVEDFWIRRGSVMQGGDDILNLKEKYIGDFDMAEVEMVDQVTLTAQCLCNVLNVLLG